MSTSCEASGHGKGRRLMVVLDWESLNVSPRLIEKVDRRLRCLIEARFGTCWEEVLHRIYIGTSDKETPAWLRRYRSEGKLERWRLPKHREEERLMIGTSGFVRT